jgi:hypothetical protein
MRHPALPVGTFRERSQKTLRVVVLSLAWVWTSSVVGPATSAACASCPLGTTSEDPVVDVVGSAAGDCICLNPLVPTGAVSTNLLASPNYLSIGAMSAESVVTLQGTAVGTTAFHDYDGDGDFEVVVFDANRTMSNYSTVTADSLPDGDIDVVVLGSMDSEPNLRLCDLDGDSPQELYVESRQKAFATGSVGLVFDSNGDVDVVVVGTQDLFQSSFGLALCRDADFNQHDAGDRELVLPAPAHLAGSHVFVDGDGDFDLLLEEAVGIPALSERGLILLALLLAAGLVIVWRRHAGARRGSPMGPLGTQ